MPNFTEDFASLGDWYWDYNPSGGNFVTATAPAGLVGVTTAGKITEKPSGVDCDFSVSRLDLVGGGDETITYWLTYALYVEDWSNFNPGSGNYFLLPGMAYFDDPDNQYGNGNFPILKATSGSTGYFQGFFGPPSDEFADGTWHTMRIGFRNDGVIPLTEVTTYFDNELLDFTSFAGAFTPVGNGGMFGVSLYDDQCDMDNAVVYIAAMNWSVTGDPGEPATVIPPEPPPDYSGVHAFIDGAEVTTCVQSGSFTRRLNRPASATLRMFTDCTPSSPNYRIKIIIDNTLWFHGMVSQISTEAGEDGNLMTEYTAFDPMWMWQWRVARAGPASEDPGDFSNPDLFTAPTTNLADKGMAAVIMEQILLQSEVADDAEGEGPLFLEIGDFSAFNADVDLSGAPTDYPMTIAEVFELMSSTGTFDCIITPIDDLPNMGRVDAYLGDYGTDHSDGPDGDGTCVFEYATGSHNVRQLRMTEDSSNIVNKLWYYLGPRVESATDPAGDQHWRANVTGSADGVHINPLNHPPYNDPSTDPPFVQDVIIDRRDDSRENWGTRMEVRIYDAQGDENPAQFRHLYYRLWQEESWLRAIPRTLVHITPVRLSEAMLLPPDVDPVQLGDFDIGDLVTVTAGPVVRGGFTGVQRIYSFTVDWDEDGILELGELQVSSDAEGV